MIGRGDDVLRLPMVPVSDATRKKLEALVSELGLLEAVSNRNAERRAS
jgi:4-hydroxy-tetrahydrodipicolinate synthase